MTLRKITGRFVKKTLALALLAGLVTAAGLHAAAQGNSGLGDKVERSLKAKDPSWRIQYKKKAGGNTRQMWAYGKDSVTVSIVEEASAEQAAQALAASASSVKGAQALKEGGVGDEAYLIAADSTPNPERGEAAGVMFRKGNVLVYVNVRSHGSGGGAGVAQLFAQHVAEQIQ
ncbi:MAG TPA: hypothetical protein VGP08_09300 [Pyrinomonadaceae bacterium]|jgi:hypothetical protein|nr:hypothetical protein [Pyrinomonadaceae bacterium]